MNPGNNLNPYKMKKLIFSLTLLTTAYFSNSQSLPVQVGFHGGINLNTIRGNEIADQYSSAGMGFNVGLDLKVCLTERFRLILTPGYENLSIYYKSVDLADESGYLIGRGDLKHNFNYINIPILAEVLLGRKSNFKLSAGPFLGVFIDDNISYEVREEFPNNPEPMMFSVSNKSNFGINYGIAVGTGIIIPINKKLDFNVELRDEFGIANLNKSETSSVHKIRANSFNLLLGISFQIN